MRFVFSKTCMYSSDKYLLLITDTEGYISKKKASSAGRNVCLTGMVVPDARSPHHA
jgi:hypothetical protein